jgi:N-terminal acetyltransferase B complex non-catalytic subunit
MAVGITVLKLEYFFKSSCAELSRRQAFEAINTMYTTCKWCEAVCGVFCESCLENIACKGLHAYGRDTTTDTVNLKRFLLPTDRHPADGWAIIAAMCLFKLSHNSNLNAELGLVVSYCSSQAKRLLQAAVILEVAHQRSRPNPDITLLLVRVYLQLGAGSLAMQTYQSLHLKQIQNHTLGWVILDRISTIHPKNQAESRGIVEGKVNPARDLEKLQQLYRKTKLQTQNNIWKSLEHGSFETVLQLTNFYNIMSASRTVAISVSERRRVERLDNPRVELKINSHGFDLIRE